MHYDIALKATLIGAASLSSNSSDAKVGTESREKNLKEVYHTTLLYEGM